MKIKDFHGTRKTKFSGVPKMQSIFQYAKTLRNHKVISGELRNSKRNFLACPIKAKE
jgi:hypothetical protein